MTWSTLFVRLCAYVWALNTVLYGALYIVCHHIYVHSIALCVPGGLSMGIPLVLVSAQFLSYLPGDNQGARGLLPTICAYSFSVCRIQISQVCYSYVGLGLKLHTCILFTIYVHYIFMNATSYTRYYLFSVQVNQYFTQYQLSSFNYQYQFSKCSIFISIDISRFSFSTSF